MDKIIQDIYKNLIRDMEEDEISRALKKEVLELMGDSGEYTEWVRKRLRLKAEAENIGTGR